MSNNEKLFCKLKAERASRTKGKTEGELNVYVFKFCRIMRSASASSGCRVPQASSCQNGAIQVCLKCYSPVTAVQCLTSGYSSAHSPQFHFQCLLLWQLTPWESRSSPNLTKGVLQVPCTKTNKTVPSKLCCPVGSARQLHAQQIKKLLLVSILSYVTASLFSPYCSFRTYTQLTRGQHSYLARRRPGVAATECIAMYGRTKCFRSRLRSLQYL